MVPFLLRETRITAGLTQRALAERVGITQPNIADYERGARLPRIDTADRLAEALGLDSIGDLWRRPTSQQERPRAVEAAGAMTTSEVEPDAAPRRKA